MLAGLTGTVGCKSGLLNSGEWGTLRYFGELTGIPEVEWDEEDNNEALLELIPPISDRNGNIYVLYEDPNGDSVVYVGAIKYSTPVKGRHCNLHACWRHVVRTEKLSRSLTHVK